MTKVLLLPAAEDDVQEALDWYAERSIRAAAGFEQALEKTLRAVAANPEGYGLIDDGHRAALLKRHPYHVVYRMVESDVVVIAVAHGRRSSNFWQARA